MEPSPVLSAAQPSQSAELDQDVSPPPCVPIATALSPQEPAETEPGPTELVAPLPPPAQDTETKPQSDPVVEALRLKSLAEDKLRSSCLRSAIKYAKRAARLAPDLDGISQMVAAIKVLRADSSDHYKVLRLPPFSSPLAVRKQYKTLSLALRPDHAAASLPSCAEDAFKCVTESFRVLSDRSLKRDYDLRLRLSLSSAAATKDGRAVPPSTFWTACTTCRLLHEFKRKYVGYRLVCPSCRKSFLAVEVPGDGGKSCANENGVKIEEDTVRITHSRSNTRSRIPRFPEPLGDKKRKTESPTSAVAKTPRSRPEKTLAEMVKELWKSKEKRKSGGAGMDGGKGKEAVLGPVKQEYEDVSLMAVEDSDFYDFDKDRLEKSFRKGQIWAIYDDDDGMPRLYGLIDDVQSIHPFRMKMNWLDIQNNGNGSLVFMERSGLCISCGQFKLGRSADINSVNFFSHLVNCERAALELYRIYPKKGSVWALYGEQNAGEEGRYYDIVVCLTSHSEVYGLSIAFLEKAKGYKTIFKRQEIGCHAIKFLQKDELKLLSHQVPARKISEAEGLDLPGDCWELDPASLPPHLLKICCA
ncbi:uncharacterized protein LOC121974530 [Zingiber officinale]|uniref:J domain-containing protein n=1 Tax=Zingiber officinale TaxID=94328 RepID=A0A8J5L9B5_ZINOF|nr:uncharacterized protein LOC121974530 [Zingiber officinale]KAG6509621.1 hypothetical protein ZIOFF_027621 [Zingiber officinale]